MSWPNTYFFYLFRSNLNLHVLIYKRGNQCSTPLNQEKTDTQLLQKIDFISPLEITSCFVILSKWNLRRRTHGKISPFEMLDFYRKISFSSILLLVQVFFLCNSHIMQTQMKNWSHFSNLLKSVGIPRAIWFGHKLPLAMIWWQSRCTIFS